MNGVCVLQPGNDHQNSRSGEDVHGGSGVDGLDNHDVGGVDGVDDHGVGVDGGDGDVV